MQFFNYFRGTFLQINATKNAVVSCLFTDL